MNLMDEEIKPKNDDKSKKTLRLLIILMVLVLVGIITIIIFMSFLKNTPKESIKIDGKEQAELKSIIKIQEDGKIYIPIKDIASYLGYSAYNGNYTNKSENTSECYIESKNEVASFKINSNKIEKINKSSSEKTYITMDEPVQLQDEKLCISIDGLEKAYNLYFNYNSESGSITIMTMQYIINSYEQSILELGYKEISKRQ